MPFFASAENLNLKSAKTSYSVGDSFSVSLTLDTNGRSINTLSATIFADKTRLQIVDVRYGSSIISLWVERPKIDSSGNIVFVGGVPGGFSGSAGPILTFGVRAKSEGQTNIGAKDIKILLNDGQGTELAGATSGILKLSISKASPQPAPAKPGEPAPKEKPKEEYIPPPDTTPPESFIPMISRHPSVADNKYFASFFAVDKDSGISYYEIQEKPLLLTQITANFDTKPARSESPYILKGQLWTYKIVVRAYDQAGNFMEGYAVKPLSPIAEIILVLILLAAAILITRWWYNKA
ncbi:hypothetical protein A3I36_00295 [Candidatus Giovannonibacteria bacterium RIFCSPLOWO2_02_FULL_45_28]|uniref:Cohesin domain-containing protein n=1 Tax=Candidatus Giovannonibacteria bacterium RIFCSPHIGHO2_02_FULL_45_40 TaxID=1798337 RepID=A0A1F5WAT1_9BACT|nr:MAG: hypothetical protein A2120_04090 [Candidatus Giovannonibacteria bacterium GWA2_45_15]OGF59516.1 MAG: hypothetical protein A2W40_02720 [Candidatus Giovannonibacteria bacterium RIFCSPHIGHO2_01_45_12]OGF60502.1 MAG: hypothetical protein A2656_00255 [Candidatus Giovannonibacteria bacterium RIFCSPHIGHO2_01_FULL_44_100]OGF72743.1 MAG: hypothetical protein A3C05_03170 [Candidatus Giovannonibacteria bacterium RIFCSPHIGHO2_02_FULL_45_40]OGF83723.1 MAG: hypothetical protein A3E63_02205 [Candidatu